MSGGHTMWKLQKIILQFLYQDFTFTKFSPKRVGVNLRNFHTVMVFSLTHFWQKFRESNGFTKKVTKE